MKFSLKGYSDLGKCAYATLMDEFDTDKNEILVMGKKVEIKSLEDLFQYIWNIPGVECYDNAKHTSVASFGSPGTWWDSRYGESIKEHEADLKKLEKRLGRAADSRKPKIQEQIKGLSEHIDALKRIVKRNNDEMEELKEKLRHENGL